MRSIVVLTASVAFMLSTGASQAATIDISAAVNADVSNYTFGSLYPAGGTPLTVNGVDFTLASGSLGGPGVFQTSSTALTYTFNVNITGASSVYTLMNSAFGTVGAPNGSISFYGSSGTSTYQIVQGINIRDHFNGSFNNSATGLFGSAFFPDPSDPNAPVRLDAQSFDVSSLGTISQIVFQGLGLGTAGGDPFLAALSTNGQVLAVPLHPSLPVTILGLVGLGYMLNRRRAQSSSIVA